MHFTFILSFAETVWNFKQYKCHHNKLQLFQLMLNLSSLCKIHCLTLGNKREAVWVAAMFLRVETS